MNTEMLQAKLIWGHGESHFSCLECGSWSQEAKKTGARGGEKQRQQDLLGLSGLKGDPLRNVAAFEAHFPTGLCHRRQR